MRSHHRCKDVTKVVDYGSEAVYDDDFPVKTDMESAYSYSLFQGWDKSTGNIKGDTVVNAIWDRVDLPAAGTELSDMNLTQLYAIRQSGKAAEYVSKKDRFAYRLGYEPIFDDVESVVLAENVSLDGQTRIDTGIKLFSEDRDWTMVIDGVYEQPTEGACLMSCFTEDGFHGFKAKYRGGFAIRWSSNSVTDGVATSVSTVGDTPVLTGYQRDLAVLRHRKGNPNLTVYLSKPGSSSVVVTELTKTITTVSDATIVIGCDNDGANYCFGELYRAKLWYDDLGDAECRKMAVWPGEDAALEVIGTAGANLAAGGKTIVDFINASLFCAAHRMNPTNSNEGAWPEPLIRSGDRPQQSPFSSVTST